MKILNRFLLPLLAILMPILITSCDKDEPSSGADALSTNVSSVILGSAKNSNCVMTINSKTSWNITGGESWLRLSSLGGTGTVTITLTATEENLTASPRSCTLVVSTSDGKKSVSVTVTQDSGVASCKVTPFNVTALSYAVSFGFDMTKDVRNYKCLVISDYEIQHKNISEIMELVEAEEANIPSDMTIFTRPLLYDNRTYHILSIAYNDKGERGELIDVTFFAPAYLEDNDAWVIMSYGLYSSNSGNYYFFVDTNKRERCTTYDIIYGTNITRNLSGPVLAYEIQYYRNYKKLNWLSEEQDLVIELDYPNDSEFTKLLKNPATSFMCCAATWGHFIDGSLSSFVNLVSYNPEESGEQAPLKLTPGSRISSKILPEHRVPTNIEREVYYPIKK